MKSTSRLSQAIAPELPTGGALSILGVDPGRNAGWALVSASSGLLMDCGAYHQKGKGPFDPASYLEHFEALFREITRSWDTQIGLVVIEAFIRVPGASGVYASAQSRVLLEAAAIHANIPFWHVFPASWRSFYHLPKKSNKEDSKVLATRLLHAPANISHDTADACLLAHYAQVMVSRPRQLGL